MAQSDGHDAPRLIDELVPCRATMVDEIVVGSALGPAAGDLVLLADAGLVGEPDLYMLRREGLLMRDRLQARGEAFLKSSIAPAA